MTALRKGLAFASALVLLATAGASAQTRSASDIIPSSQRLPAPGFKLVDVNGAPYSLSSTRGKVVLLDFWAITCGGCKLELPWYVEFQHKYGGQGLDLVGLDMYGESPNAVKAFAASHGMNYPLAIGTDEIGNRYHLREMPLTVLIDRQGRIAVSHAGVIDPAVFEGGIKTLLAER